MTVRVIQGDCREVLATLPAGSVQCCVTSPPYYGLRDYRVAGQIGLEASPDVYVGELVAVFREVRRVLADDGTVWLNLGDSYAGSWGAQGRGGAPSASSTLEGHGHRGGGPKLRGLSAVQIAAAPKRERTGSVAHLGGVKEKDLLGITWMVAFALRADGWFLRRDIIWHKPNPMPESVRDRPTSAHEYVFLLSKSAQYFYDAAAIAEPAEFPVGTREDRRRGEFGGKGAAGPVGREPFRAIRETRNARSVWTIPTQPYAGAHFATMPRDLAERCIKAGSRGGDTVLDPFGGAGTTGLVADRLGRNAVLIELNGDYARQAEQRMRADAPLLVEVGG